MKKIIILFLLLLMVTECFYESPDKYVSRKINIDVSHCSLEKNVEDRGFHGDGDTLIVFDCSESNLIDDVKNWKSLPLSENLELIMYGGEKDDLSYWYYLAKENDIPKITNGYYYFINRHDSAKSKDDDDIFNKYSFNFTLALYDTDNNKLYYYEFDT